MDQLVQCPVCTLYLHSGMSLESHLDTHPKDQVIKALCNLSVSKSNYGSRSSTPMHSERSYRSRSRTPAVDESNSKWSSTHNNNEQERFWRRSSNQTPSRASSRTPRNSITTRTNTPSDLRIGDLTFENMPNTPATLYSMNSYSDKSDKPQIFTNGLVTDYDRQCLYNQEQSDETEMKYSRSAEYNEERASSMYGYSLHTPSPGVNMQTLGGNIAKKSNDFILGTTDRSDYLIKKPNNIALLKTNIAPLQYLPPGVKPVHVMIPATSSLVHTSQNIMSGNMANAAHNKTPGPPTLSNQYSHLTSSTFPPNKTVVTQNSQIIYREMVHNMDGKPFISGLPAGIDTADNVRKLTQTSSVYQNVMVVDPFGNTSCMYTQQPVIPHTTITAYHQNSSSEERSALSINKKDVDKKSLVVDDNNVLTQNDQIKPGTPRPERSTPAEISNDTYDSQKSDTQSSMKKGLKILSNIKVEVPVQHHKSMLNAVFDLTDVNDCDSPKSEYPENQIADVDTTRPSTSTAGNSKNFSAIHDLVKNQDHKESLVDKVSDYESTDSCPVPDLICNEKPSISPCSELSENSDNAVDHNPLSPKVSHNSSSNQIGVRELKNQEKEPLEQYWNHGLKSNNLSIRKHKKILQIKNSKYPKCSDSNDNLETPSCSKKTDMFIHKMGSMSKAATKESGKSSKSPRQKSNDSSYVAPIMNTEPHPHTSFSDPDCYDAPDIVQVKDEVNSTSETFNSAADSSNLSDKCLTPLESIRPINVIGYGNLSDNFDDDSNHRELLDLEVASKNKQFVNMMSENYFGDNIYADYFTPDKVESFNAVRESVGYSRDAQKGDGRCDYMWGESQKESYVLPNFVHETFKMGDNSTCVNYSLNSGGVLNGVDFGGGDMEGDGEMCEQDSKLDVLSESRSESEVALDICADEKMPPRGELSGQESNGDMDAPWTGMYPDVTPTEPYDLIARESWISDGSEIDSTEKGDDLEDELPNAKPLRYSCAFCDVRVHTLKELDTHRALAHASTSATSATAAKLVYDGITARNIKKENKCDILPETTPDLKTGITSPLFDDDKEAKPNIEVAIIKKEPRKRREYVCPTCKEDLGSDAAFHHHLRIHPLECLTCGKCFFKKSSLNIHLRIHLGIRRFGCEICLKRFMTKQKLQEHQNIHTGRAPIKCTHCAETFRRHSNMVQHRNRHHFKKRPKIRDYVCHCGEIFHSRAKLKWHKEIHEDKPKACQYCSDKFIHSSSLTRHVRRSHNAYYIPEGKKFNNNMQNVPCPICKQVYLRSTLKSHLMTHSGKRPFFCVICNKYFTTKWNLKLHKWVHMSRSAKPYKCSLCKSAFIRQSEFISHMNAHKSVRPYTCNYCGCQFIRKYNCQRHVKEHEMAKKYVCKVPDCGKTFHRSYYLTEHMRVHSGARPFSCNICGKTSSNKSNHNKHVKIHHAREPVATEA